MYMKRFCLLVNTCNIFYNKNFKRKLTSNPLLFLKGYSTEAFNLRRNLTLDGVRVDHILFLLCPQSSHWSSQNSMWPTGSASPMQSLRGEGHQVSPLLRSHHQFGISGLCKRRIYIIDPISRKMPTNATEPGGNTKLTLKIHYFDTGLEMAPGVSTAGCFIWTMPSLKELRGNQPGSGLPKPPDGTSTGHDTSLLLPHRANFAPHWPSGLR